MKETIKELPQVTDLEEAIPEPEIKSQKYLNLCESVADMLAHGCGIEGTAAKFGLSKHTVYRWLKTAHFQALVELKKEEYRLYIMDNIKQIAKDTKQWTGFAWLGERNKALKGEFHPPAVEKLATGNIQINVMVGQAPNNRGETKIIIGETDNISGGLEEKDNE